MMMSLYRQATTTPKISTALQASKEPGFTLAKGYSISELSVDKWKNEIMLMIGYLDKGCWFSCRPICNHVCILIVVL
ncbi:MAG: hypothetical protein ACTS73_04725 [Arsenophonus sp. NEOnobi-MAG3]